MYISCSSTDEERNIALDEMIKKYKDTVALVPNVVEVLKKFDGKVFNCKLDEALRDATGNDVSVFSSYGNDFYSIKADGCDCGNRIALAHFRKSELKDKRLDATCLISEVEKSKEELLSKVTELEEKREYVHEYKRHIKEAVDELESYINSIPTELKDIFRIPGRIECRP